MAAPSRPGRYEERPCWRCDEGRVYDGRGWVPCHECGGSGSARVFVYPTWRGLRSKGARS